MRAKHMMTQGLEAVEASASAADAASRMEERGIGFLAVMREGKLVGALTDRDIVTRVLAEGLDPSAVAVTEVLSPAPIHCREDFRAGDVAQLMTDNRVRRVIVFDDAGAPSGVISVADLAVHGDRPELAAEVLASVGLSRYEEPPSLRGDGEDTCDPPRENGEKTP